MDYAVVRPDDPILRTPAANRRNLYNMLMTLEPGAAIAIRGDKTELGALRRVITSYKAKLIKTRNVDITTRIVKNDYGDYTLLLIRK